MKEVYKTPLIYILIFFIVIYFLLAKENILLSDDLARFLSAQEINKHNISFFKFIGTFINTPTMTSRPVSGFIYGCILYLSKYNADIYYINYIFFLISLVSVFILLKKLLNENLASIIILVYSLSVVSSSMVFSPIMMNANLAIIFYSLSLLVLLKNKSFGLSLIFYFLSVFSYEILIPCIIVNILILNGKWLKKILYLTIGIFGVYTYREILEPSVFSNYFHRDQKMNILNFERNYTVIKSLALLIFLDIPKSIYRAILAIRFYSLFDYISLISLGPIFGYFIIFKFKTSEINKRTIIIAALGVVLSFSIFFFSGYNPSIYGFYNRNLGGFRLFGSIFFILILLYIFTKRTMVFKSIVLTVIICLVISTISIKNAWVYGSNINENIFFMLKKHLNEDVKKYPIYILFDAESLNNKDKFYQGINRDRYEIYQDRHFVLKEPIYLEEWESAPLQLKSNISLDYSINYFFYSPKEKSIPYYVYDYKTDTLKLIE